MTATNKKTSKQLRRGMATILALAVALAATTLALTQAVYGTDNNWFTTGTVDIDLCDLAGNSLDGTPLIKAGNFAPGAVIREDFQVKNKTVNDFYYKFYFTGIGGGLANVIQVSITERVPDATQLSDLREDQFIYKSITLSDLTRDKAAVVGDALAGNDSQDFTIWFYFPEEATNEAQNLEVSFNFTAEAVQTKNNTNKQFGEGDN
jgi:hypothetical protein